jgi:hypothetical protein
MTLDSSSGGHSRQQGAPHLAPFMLCRATRGVEETADTKRQSSFTHKALSSGGIPIYYSVPILVITPTPCIETCDRRCDSPLQPSLPGGKLIKKRLQSKGALLVLPRGGGSGRRLGSPKRSTWSSMHLANASGGLELCFGSVQIVCFDFTQSA